MLAHLAELLARMPEGGTGTAVMMFDIDHFKQVNDRWGHPAGDDVLRELSERTLRQVRSVDLAARIGGEEFVVVMPETNLAGAAVVADRLRLAVADQPFTLQGYDQKLPVTVSIGVAVTNSSSESLEALLKRADDALYAAKNGGRNRVVAAPPASHRMPVAIAS